MLSIAWATVQTRWAAFAGAFGAVCLGAAVIAMMVEALAATTGSQQLQNAQGMAATTAAVAVLVAVFIVIATFAFVVEQRARELALLRLVGASPAQIRRMVLAESALIGVAAAAVGCVLGCFGAAILNKWMISHRVAPSWFHIGVNPIALTIAFAASVASALVGATAVAWRASRIRPVAALRQAAASQRAMTPLRWVLGLGMLAAAVITGIAIARTDPQYVVNPRKYLMVPLLYVGGVALLAPVLLQPVSRLVTWPLAHVGAGPLIVRQNVLNARRRTAAIVTPAVVAVGLMTATMCLQDAGTQAKVEQVRETVHANMVVARSSVPALPSVTETPEAQVPLKIGLGGQVIDSLTGKAVPPAALGTVLTPRVLQGSLHHLGSGFIVVDQRTALGDGISLGQELTVWLPDGARTHARIKAIIQTGLAGDDTYISTDLVGSAAPSLVWLSLRPGTSPASVRRSLGSRAVISARSYAASLERRLQAQSRTAATVILGISIGYALIAIANTMIMAAAGRRRELAAMRLAGSTRSQTLGIVSGEALVAVLVAAMLAAPVGIAEIVTQNMSLTRLVTRVPAIVPWADVLQTVVLCTIIGMAFAMLAAWHTTRGWAVEAARD